MPATKWGFKIITFDLRCWLCTILMKFYKKKFMEKIAGIKVTSTEDNTPCKGGLQGWCVWFSQQEDTKYDDLYIQMSPFW